MTRLYGGNMGRARYSQGYVKLTPTNLWQANWFPYIIDPLTGQEKRVHRTQIVGSAPKMRKYQAEQELRKIVQPLQENHGEQTTFGWFMNKRWIPMKEGGWRPSSKQAYSALIAALDARFGAVPLRSMDKVEMQSWLNAMANERYGSTVKRLRVMLKSILEEAVDQEYLDKDPARKLTVPKGMKKSDKTVLSWEQLKAILECLNQRDRLILMIEMTAGLRPSELFALRRRSFSEGKLTITETIYRGELREYGKTDGSLTTVDLPSPLSIQLTEWLAASGDDTPPSSPDSFLFHNSTGGFIQKTNFLMRVIYPIRDSLGLPKLNFQVLRRTFATLAQKHGGPKDIQRQLRHSKADMTVNTYMQPIDESVKSMVEAMYEEMTGPRRIQ